MLLLKFRITTRMRKKDKKIAEKSFEHSHHRADKCFLFMYHALLLFIVFLFFHRLCHTATTIIIISKYEYCCCCCYCVVMGKHKNIFFHLEREAKSCHQTRFSRLIYSIVECWWCADNIFGCKKWFIFYTNCLDYNVNLNRYE